MPETSDTTPLLAASGPLERCEYEPQDASAQQWTPSSSSFKATVILSTVSAIFAAAGFVCDLTAVTIGMASSGMYYMPWSIREPAQGMCAASILAFFASVLNLARLKSTRRPLWPLVNLIIDGVIVYFTLMLCPEGLVNNFDLSPTHWLPDKTAFVIAKKVQVLVGLGLGFGVALGVTHLALFLLRCFLSFNDQSWGGSQVWRLPQGQFKIEFSIKFIRPNENLEARE